MIGETKENNHGTLMKIIEYNNSQDIIIQFQDDYKYQTKTTYQNFKRGDIKNPYNKTIFNIGYLGEGQYKAKINYKLTKQYNSWKSILARCYGKKYRSKYPAYKGCTVCSEWLNFQTFAKWYDENFYNVGHGRMHIDKDILHKGNKVYSPDNCIFVPQEINVLFIHTSNKKGLPSAMVKNSKGYKAFYNAKPLGQFYTIEEALKYYMIEKRLYIKKVANEYKDKIPQKVYEALINW